MTICRSGSVPLYRPPSTGAAKRGDPRAFLQRREPLEVDGLGEEVEPQLDELGPRLHRFFEFGHHHLVAGPADHDQHPIRIWHNEPLAGNLGGNPKSQTTIIKILRIARQG